MTYDETRQQVVLFGGSAAPSATATADDLFSDTWELPLPAGLVMPTAPILDGFAVNPNVVPQLLPFTLEVLLNQPAQTPTSVMVTESSGLLNEISVVPAGSTSASLSLNPPSATLPPGIYSLTATLGGITLTASLQVL
jgi:hypothetical protein